MDTSRIHNTMDNLSQLLGYTTPVKRATRAETSSTDAT